MSATASFLARIDGRHAAGERAALRYRHVLRFSADADEDGCVRDHIARTSIREGLRIFPLLEHRGVAVDVLDLSSLMHSRTLKSLDGCVTIAHCLARGIGKIAFESGGNTATALALYGRRAGLETFCFVPTANLGLLDRDVFAAKGSHLIAVDDASAVQDVVARFVETTGIPRVPETEWRLQASTVVGCFVLESLLAGPSYDWLVQSISAAFGPIGIYRILLEHRAELERVPRFLGVQQAANCPMVHAWRATRAPAQVREPLLVEVMYDRDSPRFGTVGSLQRVLEETSGDLSAIAREQYERHMRQIGGEILARFAASAAPIAMRDGEVAEKAGVVALVGALEAIGSGQIARGSRILVCLTGGTGAADGRATPDLRLQAGELVPDDLGRRRAAAADGGGGVR